MKGKITAVLFILVFLLVVAVVFTFLTSLDRRREAEAAQNRRQAERMLRYVVSAKGPSADAARERIARLRKESGGK